MIILGIVLVLAGYLVGIPILETLGVILLIVGVLLLLLGGAYPVAGRRHWF